MINEYWGRFLGYPLSELHDAEVVVCTHGPKLSGFAGAWLFRQRGSVVISVPRGMERKVEAALPRREKALFSEAGCRELFGKKVDAVTGPGWIGYVDRNDFCPVDTGSIRRLQPQDKPALLQLVESCGRMGFEHGGVGPEHHTNFGLFIGDELVSAACYEVLIGKIASVGFVTHPLHRGRGYGRAVAAAVTRQGLDEGLTLQWQTMKANEASMKVAGALGYRGYAEYLVARLCG